MNKRSGNQLLIDVLCRLKWNSRLERARNCGRGGGYIDIYCRDRFCSKCTNAKLKKQWNEDASQFLGGQAIQVIQLKMKPETTLRQKDIQDLKKMVLALRKSDAFVGLQGGIDYLGAKWLGNMGFQRYGLLLVQGAFNPQFVAQEWRLLGGDTCTARSLADVASIRKHFRGTHEGLDPNTPVEVAVQIVKAFERTSSHSRWGCFRQKRQAA